MDERPLTGRTVRISSDMPAAALTAQLLADLGARTVAVPVDVPAEVVDRSGVAAPGAAVLSPFGPHGRFAGGPDHHAAVAAVGGALLAQYTYEPGPAYLVSPYATVGQALLAAAAVVSGWAGGADEPRHVSGVQAVLALQAGFYSFGAEPEPERFDHTPRGQTPVYSVHRAADDWLFVGASTTPFMIKVLQAVGLEDVLTDPRVLEHGARALRDHELRRQVWERMDPIMARRPRADWLATFEKLGVPAGPVLPLEEAIRHPHIPAAGLVGPEGSAGGLTRLVAVARHGDGRPRTPEPRGPLPLSGLRVVELAGYIAGPYVGRLLADMGADVVKIEPPDGDPFRVSGYGFAAWNHGKRSLSLNLRDAADRARLLALVREADILVTNYRPEALDRMGVGRELLFAANPGLIHCTVSAYGETGPLARLPGFDPVVQGFAGIMRRQGGDGEPVKPQMAATDYLSGMLGALGVLAARAAQLERGGGYVVRTSLLAAALLANYEAYEALREGRPYLTGGRDYKGPHALHGLHRAADGWLLTVAPDATPARFPAACRYLTDGVAHAPVTEAVARLEALGVPAVSCIDPWDLTGEPHFRDNNLWTSVMHPELGALTLPAPVLGPRRDGEPSPSLGEHNTLADVWREPQTAGG